MKALVAGWFSYANGHATAGDLLTRDLLCDWLRELGMDYEIAVAPPFTGGPSLAEVDAHAFTHAFFICGPFGHGELEYRFLRRFAHCRLVGLNLSLDIPTEQWDPFDFLIERDSVRDVNPEMLFASRQHLPSVVGVCLVEPHEEADVAGANAAIDALLQRREAARVMIDTRLDTNETGLRTAGEVEALIARVDVLVTTRLHGLVMALKNGVPAVVIDAVPGGGKIRRQCSRIGWTNVLGLEELDADRLDRALDWALSEDARATARRCAEQAAADVLLIKGRLREQLSGSATLEQRFVQRQTDTGMAAFLSGLPTPPIEDRNSIRQGWRSTLLRWVNPSSGGA